jgi:hypothetical protein
MKKAFLIAKIGVQVIVSKRNVLLAGTTIQLIYFHSLKKEYLIASN